MAGRLHLAALPSGGSAEHAPADVLVLDDEPYFVDWVARTLARGVTDPPVAVRKATTPADALSALRALAGAQGTLVVISDYNLRAPMNGLQFLAEVARVRPDAWRVLVTGHAREELGSAIDQAELDAFFEKPFDLKLLAPKLVAIVSDAMKESR